jgi:serine/threonine protein kinase
MTTENSAPEARYTHFEKIGEGGVGEVYKAWDTQLQRWVAIKRMIGQGDLDNTASISAWHEAMRMASFSHPHIVTVYDFGRDEKGSYVVMEFLEGETLDSFISRGVMREEDFMELMKQILEGVVAAHQKSLVHRDLKPGNIMLVWLPSGRFQAKVLDFGLAEFLKGTHTTAMDASGSLLGSVYYMAPEQCQGGMIDARADLYALGCIGYFCLTGRNAFDGDDVGQVMQAHLDHRLIPLLQLRPDISAGLASWVEQLMSLAPEQRPSSAALALQNLNVLSESRKEASVASKNAGRDANVAGAVAAPKALPVLPEQRDAGIKWAVGIAALILLGAFGGWLYMKEKPTVSSAATSASSVPSVSNVDGKKTQEGGSEFKKNEHRQHDRHQDRNATRASNSAKRYNATDVAALRSELGNVVTVEGDVVRWGQNKAKTLYYINFDQDYNQAITLVVPVQRFLEEDQEAALKGMVGKRVRYTGKVSEFQNRLQIFVDDVENVVVE